MREKIQESREADTREEAYRTVRNERFLFFFQLYFHLIFLMTKTMCVTFFSSSFFFHTVSINNNK